MYSFESVKRLSRIVCIFLKTNNPPTTDYKLRCKELLHILEQDPTLNKQLGSQSSYDIKTIIIKAHPQHRK